MSRPFLQVRFLVAISRNREVSANKLFAKKIRASPSASSLEDLLLSSPPTLFNAQNIVTSMDYLARFSSKNKLLYNHLLSLAEPIGLNPGELMDLCVAISELDQSVSLGKIPEFIIQRIYTHSNVALFKPRFFSFILFSLASLNQKEPRIVNKFAEVIMNLDSLEEFGGDDLGLILHSLCLLECPLAKSVCEKAAKEIAQRNSLARFDGSDFALILSSMYSTQCHLPSNFLPAIAQDLLDFSLEDYAESDLKIIQDMLKKLKLPLQHDLHQALEEEIENRTLIHENKEEDDVLLK